MCETIYTCRSLVAGSIVFERRSFQLRNRIIYWRSPSAGGDQ